MTASSPDDPARALRAFCDTVVPSAAGEPAALMRLSATEAGVADTLAAEAGRLVVSALGQDFADDDEPSRTRRLLRRIGDDDPESRALWRLRAQVLALFYGLADGGCNPTWSAIGYPGPMTAPPTLAKRPKRIPLLTPTSDDVIEADVCIVGSGAGGAVIASRLQQSGRSVVVLEQGGYTSESDLRQEELHDGALTYLNGGLFW